MHIFPFAVLVAVILFVSLALVFSGFVKMNAEDANNKAFQIGIVGDTQDSLFQFGKKALETFDSSRFSIDFIELSETDAVQQLQKGKLSAYIIIPKGFIDDALAGKINSIKYVTSTGSIGLTSIFKTEITKVVEEILVCSQKGVFGLEDALVDNEIKGVYKHINILNLEYIDLVINRNQIYTVQELGVSGGLSFSQYLICGISILFIFIIGLPFTSVFVKKDMSLHRVISAKGYTYTKQVSAELLSYVFVLLLIIGVVFAAAIVCACLYPNILTNETLKAASVLKLVLQALPIVLMSASFCIMLLESTSDIVSAVLLQFFAAVSLCYISGCLYPIYAFPVVVQKIAPFLPTGAARVYLQGCISNKFSFIAFIGVILYSTAFFTITCFIRRHRINKRI